MSLLPTTAVLPSHRVLPPAKGFERPPGTELALMQAPGAAAGTRPGRSVQLLADYLVARLGTRAGTASESRAGSRAAGRQSV